MRRMLLPIVMAMLLVGCGKHARPESNLPSPEVSCLLYYRWSGTSPGAGFTHTSLAAIEVDLRSGRFRRITRTANAPQPMLPWERAAIGEFLHREEWQQLAPLRSKHLAALVATWLETAPPEKYVQPRGLGIEDGYVEQMAVEAGGRRAVVTVDPRGGYRPDDPLLPPPQWRALVAFLDAIAGGRTNAR